MLEIYNDYKTKGVQRSSVFIDTALITMKWLAISSLAIAYIDLIDSSTNFLKDSKKIFTCKKLCNSIVNLKSSGKNIFNIFQSVLSLSKNSCSLLIWLNNKRFINLAGGFFTLSIAAYALTLVKAPGRFFKIKKSHKFLPKLIILIARVALAILGLVSLYYTFTYAAYFKLSLSTVCCVSKAITT